MAFSSTQTKNNKHMKFSQCKEDWGSLLLVASLSVGVIDVMDVDAAAWASSVSAILLECSKITLSTFKVINYYFCI